MARRQRLTRRSSPSRLSRRTGDSARSHSADEFIYVDEIEKGIETYIRLLNEIVL